jgi:hypothetical protein
VSEHNSDFNPYQVSQHVEPAASAPDSAAPLSLADRAMAAISFLFVYFGMMLIGFFLMAVAIGVIGLRFVLVWLLPAVVLWTVVSFRVARINMRQAVQLRLRRRPGNTTD